MRVLSSSELTDQYGYLKFDRNEVKCNTRLSQYIRLAYQTDPYSVVKFLERAWNLPRPDLIISVTGGGRRCRMSAHLRKTFQRGLVLAASTTSNQPRSLLLSKVISCSICARCLVNHRGN